MKYWLVMFLLFIVSPAIAQKFSLAPGVQVAIPQGDYKDVSPGVGFGLRVNALYQPDEKLPFSFGLELGLMEKGRTTQYFSDYVYGFYEEFKVSASTNIFTLMAVGRFHTPLIGKVRPFVDLLAGWNVFFPTVSVERVSYYSDYDVGYSHSGKASWTLSYGGCPGADIPLNKSGELYLEIKLAYIVGNHTYYKANPYIDDTMEVTFEEKNSRTDMLIPQAGVRFVF